LSQSSHHVSILLVPTKCVYYASEMYTRLFWNPFRMNLKQVDMIQSYIHARSVLPIVYICTLGACQQISADACSERMGRRTLRAYGPASRSKCVGRGSRFKCTGQWVFILAHGLVCISIFGCSQDVRHKLTKIVQLIIRSKRLGQPHVQSVWAECHLSSARANGSPY